MRTVAVVLALVTCVHIGLWASLRTKETAPDFTGQLASVSYAPFVASQHPDHGDRPTVEQIRRDLKAIAPYTRAIRTYTSLGFKPVGVMRRYEQGPDGTWHDGLLMDLLAEELSPS